MTDTNPGSGPHHPPSAPHQDDATTVPSATDDAVFMLEHGKDGDTLVMLFSMQDTDGPKQRVSAFIDLFPTPPDQGIRVHVSEVPA